jgi:hypothetical protein
MMKRNYSELPELIKLIAEIRDRALKDSAHPYTGQCPRNAVGCTDLDPCNHPDYIEFVAKEHISQVDRTELIKTFDKCREYSDLYKIPVGVFRDYDINGFIKKGYPIPAAHHVLSI